MGTEDKRLVLIADNGDKLYPYKKAQKSTSRYGFALTKPGEQDRKGQGTYTDSITEVIERLVFDDWSVRAKTIDKVGRQRDGTYGINKRSIHGYEIAAEFEGIVKSASCKPLSIIPKKKPLNTKSLEITSESFEEVLVDEITYSAIKSRRGQPEFRKALLLVYSGKCCITESSVESVLEAAHIVPHKEKTDYSVANGLLLRADVHTLFDLNLIMVNANGMVIISEHLKKSEYWQFHGKYVAKNISKPMSSNLHRRFEENY